MLTDAKREWCAIRLDQRPEIRKAVEEFHAEALALANELNEVIQQAEERDRKRLAKARKRLRDTYRKLNAAKGGEE